MPPIIFSPKTTLLFYVMVIESAGSDKPNIRMYLTSRPRISSPI